MRESHDDWSTCACCGEIIEAGDPGCRCDRFRDYEEEKGDFLFHSKKDREAEERL